MGGDDGGSSPLPLREMEMRENKKRKRERETRRKEKNGFADQTAKYRHDIYEILVVFSFTMVSFPTLQNMYSLFGYLPHAIFFYSV